MKLVKNDFVEMDWDADLFVNSPKQGFITALHNYNGLGVAFYEGLAFTLFDEDDELQDTNKLLKKIKGYVKSQDPDFPDDVDGFALIMDGSGLCASDLLITNLGLSEADIEDIEKRLDDLQGYWQVYEEDMSNAE